MSNRIPATLNWLVKKRAETHGQLNRLKRERKEYIRWCENQIHNLEVDLRALDRTLSLHEIKISPDNIPEKQIQPLGNKLKYGQLKSLVLECIKAAEGGTANTKEIIYFIASHMGLIDKGEIPYKTMYDSIRYTLKNLKRNGVIISLPVKNTSHVRYFKLKSD